MDAIETSNTADFFDRDFDGIYNPDNGDFPKLFTTFINFWYNDPYEIIYAPFYTRLADIPVVPHQILRLDGNFYAFTLDCPVNSFNDNTIFLKYQIYNSDVEPIDSVRFGFYADINIGKPNDDYVGTKGSDDWMNYFYGYNKNSEFDTLLGTQPPIFSVYPFGSLSLIPDSFSFSNELRTLMISQPSTTLPPGTQLPNTDTEYYNYISGSWKDATPMTFGGMGYNPNDPTAYKVNFPYSDLPTDNTGWSGLALNQPTWDKRIFFSRGSSHLNPGIGEDDILFALHYEEKPTFDERLVGIDNFYKRIDSIFYSDFFDYNPFENQNCTPIISSKEVVDNLPDITISPNPAEDFFTITSDNQPIVSWEIFDVLGNEILESSSKLSLNNVTQVGITQIPKGAYFVVIRLKNGDKYCKKVIKV
jgi:hypothetical protein